MKEILLILIGKLNNNPKLKKLLKTIVQITPGLYPLFLRVIHSEKAGFISRLFISDKVFEEQNVCEDGSEGKRVLSDIDRHMRMWK